MIPIILTSLFMWLLIIERMVHFWREEQADLDLKQAIAMFQGGFLEAIHPPGQTDDSPSSGLITRVVTIFFQERTGEKKLDQSILEQCAISERPYLRRYLSIIGTLAAIAPLLGLLGTVSGMITTFDVISLFGTGNARAMAGGISEALITTQSGLLVAIPGLFMSAFLNRRAHRLESHLNEVVMVLKRYI